MTRADAIRRRTLLAIGTMTRRYTAGIRRDEIPLSSRVPSRRGARGRCAVSSRPAWVGVDLGGTKILAGVFSSRGEWRGREKRATPFEGSSRDLVEAIIATIDGALASASLSRGRVAAIGIGSPGPIDPERGLILRSPNIAARRVFLGPRLEKEFSRPVVLDNDVNMAVRGEWRAGAGRGRRNLVGLWIGTGIGGCVIVDGRVVTGVNRNAGELGHM